MEHVDERLEVGPVKALSGRDGEDGVLALDDELLDQPEAQIALPPC